MAQPETYSDATPDMNEAADKTAITNDQSTLASDAAVEVEDVYTGATPNALFAEDQHLQDQETVSLDDLAIQEQQKQLDMVTNLYGASGQSSDMVEAQQRLAALQEQKSSDQNLP